MSAIDMPRRLPLWQRLFFAVPLFGWMAYDVTYRGSENLWYALIAFVSMWGCAFMVFGLPGLYIPALAMVPVMFLVLLLISRG
ncbi:hypothetical protein AVO45_01410 [Ruegeria marisrubri]|uniref:Uncharacterized protein n=1 Tax=Ruegeria marisrubri TaxID=1685379 RepID=A0A124F5L8_9RHOB|nr:hypothetical protein [Ruegeria marisrubri]KUJ85676.1 hypothetical protein AVO45_01410 [Ruegeria marisrubri]